MQLTKDLKCTACGAVVNPNWKACIVCDNPLKREDVLTHDIEEMFGVLRMPLSKFKAGGYLIRIRCKHLGRQEVFIASSEREAAIGRSEGLTVYLADELIQLVRSKSTPEELQSIHKVKQTLGGVLTEAMPVKERKDRCKNAKRR